MTLFTTLLQHLFQYWFEKQFGQQLMLWLLILIPGIWCLRWANFCIAQRRLGFAAICGGMALSCFAVAAVVDEFSARQKIAAAGILLLWWITFTPGRARAPVLSSASDEASETIA